ncbi:MAG: tetratricopeptide repeat protein [Pseudanabaena sp.]
MFFDNKAGYAITSTVTIAGISSIFAISTPIEAISAQTPQEVQKIAREITVKINAESPGSGVIVARQGNTYYVATARHVVPTPQQYTIITHDGASYPVNLTSIQKATKDDLAIVSFVSDRNYRVATISTYLEATFQTRSSYDSDSNVAFGEEINQQQTIFVSGYPKPQIATDAPNQYVFNPGKILNTSGSTISNPTVRANGYRLSYTNLTQNGMSGGAVLDANGRLIAIHGMADGQKIEGDRVVDRRLSEVEANKIFRISFGTSLGIPITTFLSFVSTTGIPINLKIENTKPIVINSDEIKSWIPSQKAQQTNPVYWINTGTQNWRLGNFARSEEDFGRAISFAEKLNNNPWQAWYAKGFVAGFRRDYNQSLKNCEKAIELSSSSYEGWRCKAGALYRLGDHNLLPKALEALDRAIEINKQARLTISTPSEWTENPTDYTERGEILYALKRSTEAIQSFDKAIAIDPELASAWTNRAFVQTMSNDLQGAESSLKNALAIDANYAPAWAKRGILLVKQERYLEAVAAFDKAIELSDRIPDVWLNRGVALYYAKRKDEAIESIRKALKIDPKYTPAIELLKQIQD